MNKLFTKIAALALGATMATGVGVAVASNANDAKAVSAASAQWQLVTAAPSDWSGEYILGNGTSGTIKIMDGSSFSSSSCAGVDATVSSSKITADEADAITIAKSSTSGKYTVKLNGKYIGKNANSNGIDANATWSSNLDNVITYSSSKVVIKGNGGRVLTWYASNSNFRYYAASNNNSQLYKKVASKTLSSITLGGTYETSFTVGDTFNHTGMTVTAHYSDSTTATVTSSASWSSPDMSSAGQKTVTVSYTEGGATKTADYTITVSAPATPYITPSKNSTSGYTGLNDTVNFTFGNLSNTPTVSSSNTSVATVNTPSISSGSGSVQINFVGAGSTTVKFYDGSTEMASVSVSVTASSVTISGLPATGNAYIGKTLDLGSKITVTATGIYSDAVTWESEDDDIATVSAAGVVTGVATGDVDITVTSDDYPSATMTCTVTVSEVPPQDVLDSSVIPDEAVGSSTSTWGTASTFSDATGAVYTGRFMGVSSASFIGRLNDSTNGYIYTSTVPSNMKLVSVSIESMTASKTVGVYAQSGAYTAAPSDKSTALGTITPSSLTYTFDENSNYNAICLRGHTSATEIGTVTITYEKLAELSSVTTSGQTTSFTQGEAFAYGGTLTAHYTQGKADATVTPTAYKYGASGFNPESAGTSITLGTTLSVDTHNGKYISVGYTEDGITKWSALYQITVSYAAVSSVTIGTHTAEIGFEEDYSISGITPTVLPANAAQTTEWVVSGNTVSDDYTWNGTILTAGQTEGAITLRCRSTADNSKYDELVVTVSGDPVAAFDKASTSGYAGKTEAIGFTYGNMDDVSKITVASSNTSYVTVANDLIADEGVGLVTINFVAAGSANVTISYDGGSALASMSVTVSADSVVSVSWEATNFDVFSGTTLTSDIDNTWLASYKMASGDEGLLEYGDYTLKLGGSAITLPHTWVAADDGKTLCIEYGGVSSSTVSVAVTQTINAVYAPNTVTDTVSWTASEAADLGSKISSQGETDEGTISTGDYSWNYTRTLVSLASNKSDFISFQGETWIQLGSGNAMESIEFTTSAIPGTIKSVTVVTATAGSHELTIDVGGTKYLEDESLHLYSGTAAADNPDPTDCVKTGTGSSSGAITITIAPTASTKKAMVIRSISVTYETGGSGKTNIANDPAHKAAQRAAVAYAQAFNAAMDETENCTTGLDAAWSTCSSAYDAFKSAAAALGETEEAWAKNLVKYATAQYSDDSAEACLERMMKTYEICVQKHGKTAFMSDLVTLGRAPVSPIAIATSENVNTIAIVAIVSVISVSAIGGYFFLRKRKETN